jgi:predicted transposase YbfD/YdcC
VLVTGDAMHAQAATAEVILARGGEYLFQLKANGPAMLREIAAFFAEPPAPLPVFETADADHGRIETRRHRVTHEVGWLFSDRRYAGEPRLPGLAAIARVEAERREGDRAATSTRYFLASTPLSPERLAAAVRGHWAIENSLRLRCSTSPSTRIVRTTAATTARRISPSSAASPSTCSTVPARKCP